MVGVSFPALDALGFLKHAVSTRKGGVSGAPFHGLNFSFRVGDRPARVEENRRLFARAVGVDARRLVTVNQVHGDAVVCAAAGDAGKGAQDNPVSDGDAILTNLPGLPLFIQTADCLPVILADPVRKVVGVVHAGWKGSYAGIAAKAVAKMADHYGSDPHEVRALLGPAIGPCCFEVDPEMKTRLETLHAWGGGVFRDGFHGKPHLDLEDLNARQLLEAGVTEEHLIRTGICVVENLDLFFSHRAEQGATGRFATVVMVK